MTGNSTRRDLAMLLAGSSTAVLSPPAGRQLRSRLVPIATDRAPVLVNARPVRGKRRSRSTTSLRSSEADTCSNVNSPVRPSRAMTSIVCTNTSAVVTRSTARMHTGSARMTFGTGLIRPGAMKHRGEARSLQRSPGVLVTQNQKNTKVSPAKISKTRAAQHELERVQVDLEICCEVAGCKVRLLPLAMEEHQIECSSHFPCPLNINCKWVGPISQTVNHIVKEHHRAVACKTGPNDIILLKGWRRPETMQWITIQTCLGQDFLVMIKKCDKNRSPIFCGTVSIFGEQENADRFDYRMKLRSHDGAHRAFSYSSVVCPHHNANSVLSDSDCFRFDYSYAEKFSHEDKLEVEVSISVMKM